MAETTLLIAETGRHLGSRPSRRLRADGKVPGVLYGHGTEPVPVAVGARELRQIIAHHGTNAIVSLQIDGEQQMTLLRDLQRDPIRRAVSHVDFLKVRADEVLQVEVTIVLEGEATEVERYGGIVTQALGMLTVRCRPDRIPGEIGVDISSLEVGRQIRVGDLQLPEGVETEVDPDDLVVAAEMPRKAAAEAAEGEGEAAEGEEGAPAEGAAESPGSGGEG